jgi:hypothetical protein
VPEAATSGVGGDGGRGCPRRRQICRLSAWERDRLCVCGYAGPSMGGRWGLSPFTSVGPPPVDGSYCNFRRLS